MDNLFPSVTDALSWEEGNKSIPKASGLYAIYLKPYAKLPKDWCDVLNREDCLIYIGKSKCLQRRLNTHFIGKSASDTFRSSVGAILHCSGYLNLSPFLYKQDDQREYAFRCESKLSHWIQGNCTFCFHQMDEVKIKTNEKTLIHKYCPPINILNNPQKLEKLQKIRCICSAEAK